MNEIDDLRPLQRVDLNLFKVFEAVYRERNLTRAGEALFLSQSAVSHALSRLAAHFDGPLFVRHGRGVAPTVLAERVAPTVGSALQHLRRGLSAGWEFRPERDVRRLRLAIHVEQEPLVLPRLLVHLREHAPLIRVDCVRLSRGSMTADLSTGRLDLVLDVALVTGPELLHMPVLEDELCVMAATGRRLSAQAYATANHVVVSSRRSGQAQEDLGLGQIGVARQVVLRCQNYDAAAQMVARSGLLLTLPRRNARLLAPRHEVRIVPLPFAIPPSELHLYWHRQNDADPVNRWLRGVLLTALQDGASADARAHRPRARRRSSAQRASASRR
jgi:DNA-binding transcriptional LysR family regulator